MINKTELEIERIEEIRALQRIREEWNALLENNQTKTVELTYEWQITYWNYFNKSAKLFVIIVKEAGSIVAIAPLKVTYIRKFGIKIRHLEFIAARESNYQDFIIGSKNKDVLESILNYLISNRKFWDFLSLRHVPETSTTAHFFLNKLDDSILRRIAGIQKCIFLKVDSPWEEHFRNSRKKRAKITYRMKRLQRVGEINYFHCSDEEQFRSNLQRFFDLHRKRWNQTETPSQFNDNRYCEFYREVTQQLQLKNQIDLFVLKVGESPVALSYSFLFGRSCLIQLMAYDTEYSKGAPSMVMVELFVKQAFADGIEEIDFGDYYPYKRFWADRLKNRLNIEIYPKRILPYFIYIIKPLRDKLTQTELLSQFIGYIRQRVGS